MGTTLFLVFRIPGPSWIPGLGSLQQPQWDEHAVFMNRLFEEGRIVLGGPYADYNRICPVFGAFSVPFPVSIQNLKWLLEE